jgi:CyaY protein
MPPSRRWKTFLKTATWTSIWRVRPVIFSRQEPLRQLWLAARSGGFHFDYDEESERWMCDKSEEQLGEMLERIVLQQADIKLEFEGL